MLIEFEISGETRYIDSDSILYGYESGGTFYIAMSRIVANYNPNAEAFVSPGFAEVTMPVYADFVTMLTGYGFIEISHATFSGLCVNVALIKSVTAIDSSNTTVQFDRFQSVDSDTTISTLLSSLNTTSRGSDEYEDEQTATGSGTITLPHDYIPGSLRVYIDGGRVNPSRITESAADEYDIAHPPDSGSIILTTYKSYS